MTSPEFPCDKDLEPYVRNGELDAWQAMSITSCRASVDAKKRLDAMEKKIAELAGIVGGLKEIANESLKQDARQSSVSITPVYY